MANLPVGKVKFARVAVSTKTARETGENMADLVEPVSATRVRDLIFAFEQHSSNLEEIQEPLRSRVRTRSIGNAPSYKSFRQSNLDVRSVGDIERELVKIEAHLHYYEVYDKEVHVAFQERLFSVLIGIVTLDPEDGDVTVARRRHLLGEAQKLAKTLNQRLPYGGASLKSCSRHFANVLRKEEALVSSTQEHRSISLRTEESSPSSSSTTKDSLERSSTPEPQQPVDATDSTSGFAPSVSVSKLKRFFSFRRDTITKPLVGASRSQSFSLKATKCGGPPREEKKAIQEKEDHAAAAAAAVEEPTKDIEEEYREEEAVQSSVSVAQLKSLFEEKLQETGEGLACLLTTTNNQTLFSSREFDLPYTEMNLGAFRLKRTLSGHYMSFTGLLRNVDVRNSNDLLHKSRNLQCGAEDLHDEVDDDVDRLQSAVETTTSVGAPHNRTNAKEAVEDDDDSINLSGRVHALKKTFETHTRTTTQPTASSVSEAIRRRGASRRSIEEPIPHSVNETDPTEIEAVDEPSAISEPGKVEMLIQSFEEGETDELHRIEQVPVQRRVGQANGTEPTSETEAVAEHEATPASKPGKVEKLKQTFAEGETELHRTIEPIYGRLAAEEPVLKVPVQLRPGQAIETESTEIEAVEEPEATPTGEPGKVEMLLQSFAESETEPIHGRLATEEPDVQLRVGQANEPESTETEAVADHAAIPANEPGKVIQSFEEGETELHRTVEPVYGRLATEEPVLTVPVQLGVVQANETESTEAEAVQEHEVTLAGASMLIISGKVETLKRSFESQPTDDSSTKGPTLNAPIQLRVGQANETDEAVEEPEATPANDSLVEAAIEQANVKETEARRSPRLVSEPMAISGTVGLLKQTFETSISTGKSEVNNNHLSQLEVDEAVELQTPVVVNHSLSSIELHDSQGETIKTLSRTAIASKTNGLVKILESSSPGSNVEQLQYSAAVVSHQKVASNGQVVKKSEEIIELEEDKPHFNLNISAENLLEEILEDTRNVLNVSTRRSLNAPGDESALQTDESILEEVLGEQRLEEVDEEFEKLLNEDK